MVELNIFVFTSISTDSEVFSRALSVAGNRRRVPPDWDEMMPHVIKPELSLQEAPTYYGRRENRKLKTERMNMYACRI